ncbi:hypothetical protein P7K49_001364 [Saguinus oedipus]|uniref:Uncharacterized protein n=1 Tax=Saguinus oedipus TaxID=9490 RepID=A0ABQ9WGR5_SAGOE|nr:hypothetical protein P7K49_001364 [Saguinus oedipus]
MRMRTWLSQGGKELDRLRFPRLTLKFLGKGAEEGPRVWSGAWTQIGNQGQVLSVPSRECLGEIQVEALPRVSSQRVVRVGPLGSFASPSLSPAGLQLALIPSLHTAVPQMPHSTARAPRRPGICPSLWTSSSLAAAGLAGVRNPPNCCWESEAACWSAGAAPLGLSVPIYEVGTGSRRTARRCGLCTVARGGKAKNGTPRASFPSWRGVGVVPGAEAVRSGAVTTLQRHRVAGLGLGNRPRRDVREPQPPQLPRNQNHDDRKCL